MENIASITINTIASLMMVKIAFKLILILDNKEVIAGLMMQKFADRTAYHLVMHLMEYHAQLIKVLSV